MDSSILNTIKKLLGIPLEDDTFNTDIIMHINTVFMILSQLGIGPTGGFSISDNTTTWGDYIDEESNLKSVITYIHLKVKLLFDPPASSFVIELMKENIKELECRLRDQVEYFNTEESE